MVKSRLCSYRGWECNSHYHTRWLTAPCNLSSKGTHASGFPNTCAHTCAYQQRQMTKNEIICIAPLLVHCPSQLLRGGLVLYSQCSPHPGHPILFCGLVNQLRTAGASHTAGGHRALFVMHPTSYASRHPIAEV